MNYCDENGCMNRKRNLVEEPIEMKNIHVLPTNNYAPLVHSTNKYGGYFKSEHYSPMKEMGDSYQHIYITIDEEIKEGDWVYCLTENRVLISNVSYSKLDDRFKIILTTDNDLIKDGVQAIDDEFLEWFVKNPSCESVHVYNQTQVGYEYDEYHFILEEPFIEYTNTNDCTSMIYNPKEETAEEAAKRLYPKHISDPYNPSEDLLEEERNIFIKGAKWQAERMYSEEDLREAFKQSRQAKIFEKHMPPVYENFEGWFDKFKRKA